MFLNFIKKFVIILFLNFVLFFICYLVILAYDEGQLNESWFVKMMEFIMWIFRFPFQLGEIISCNYWRNIILNIVFQSTIISIAIFMLSRKKLKHHK